MRRLRNIIVGLLALAGLILVVLVLLVRFFVTPEQVKAVVLPMAERALHRQITLGDVRVGLFSGIELHDLVVSEPGEAEPFIVADRVLLRFQLLPLLARRVVIDEVTLEQPLIRVIRRADGSFNFSDLLQPKHGPEAAAEPVAGAEKKAFQVLVTEARISDGRLMFVDRQNGATIALTELALDTPGISLDGGVPLKLSAKLQGAPLQVDGEVRLLRKGGHFRVDLQGLDALAFEPYFRGKVPGKLSRLMLDLQGEFDLQEQVLTGKGILVGRELGLVLLARPDVPVQNAMIRTNFDLSYESERDHLAVTSLTVDVNGIAAQLDGTITALKTLPQAQLKVTVPELDLTLLKTALPPTLLGKGGELDLAGKLRGSIRMKGDLSQPLQAIESGEIALDKVQATAAAGLRPSIDGRIALGGETARIDAMRISLSGIVAEVTGRIDTPFGKPSLDAVVTLPATDLAKALAAVPEEAGKGFGAFMPGGRIEGRARLAGPLDNPLTLLKSAEVSLAGVQVTAGGQRPEFNGRLKLAGDRLSSEGLTVKLGGNTAQLAVAAHNLFGRPIMVAADVTARRFQLEPLLGGGAAATDAAAGQPEKAVPAGSAGTAELPLQASGTIRIGETQWKELVIRDLVAEYALRDHQLTISRMTGLVAGGSFSNSARIDLRRPDLAYSATLDLQRVQADDLLAVFAPQAAGSLYGAMTLQASINGSGTRWESISRTLSGDGKVSLANGRLVSPGLVRGLAVFLQLPDLKEIAFNDFRGNALIVNGKAEIDSSLLGRQLKLFPRGALGLDGSLDLSVDTRLSPELSSRIDQRGKVTRYLLDKEGWSQVPLLLSGTLQSPRFGIDPKGIQEQAGKALQQELQRGLDKLIPRPPSPPATTPAEPAPGDAGGTVPAAPAPEPPPAPRESPPPVSPAQKLLEESLKRVLTR